MPRVIFKFDIERDAWNYWATANSNLSWGHDFKKQLRPNILKMLKGKKWDSVARKIYGILEKGYKTDKKYRENNLKLIKKRWGGVEKEYFKRLSEVTKYPIYTKKFTVFITTVGRCPYFQSEDAFMIQILGKDINAKILTIAHEIMHLQFHYYYEKELRKSISNKEFHNIKEALTVLLNLEFKDLIKKTDMGYPEHKKLREFMEKEWKKKKDFDILLEKGVDYLKR